MMGRFTRAREEAKGRAKRMGDARPDWDPDQVMDSTKVPDGVVDLREISSGFLDDDME